MCKLCIMNPFTSLLILFIAVPAVEIYFLIQVGSQIGALATVFLIILTAVLGAYLFRLQGMATFQRVQASVARGEVPALEMIEGAMLLMSGAMLLTPGFVTDLLGFVCLVPVFRRKFALSILESQFINQGTFRSGPFGAVPPQDAADSDIIEGEFKCEDDEPSKLNKDD